MAEQELRLSFFQICVEAHRQLVVILFDLECSISGFPERMLSVRAKDILGKFPGFAFHENIDE